MMAAIPNNELEICIRIDRSTLHVDGAKVAKICAHLVRRRFGANVISAAVIFPPAGPPLGRIGTLTVPKQAMASPTCSTTPSSTR